MGGEFGQSSEWNFHQSLDWHLLQYDFHKGVQAVVRDLNALYRSQPALYEKQYSPEGFQWIDYGDAENSVLAYIRKGHATKDDLVVLCNLTPVPRENYRIGVPKTRQMKVLFNSDAAEYGGSGMGVDKVAIDKTPSHGYDRSVVLTLPPLSAMILR